eukprot:gene17587-23916_t
MPMMLMRARPMLHSRLAAPTAPVVGRPSRLRWTPAPPVHFASPDERLPRPAGAKDPRDSSEFDAELVRPEVMKTITACQDLTSLHKAISNRSQDFNHTHVCAAMERMVGILGTPTGLEKNTLAQQLMEELSEVAQGCVHDMDAPALCSVLGALNRVGGTQNSPLVQTIVQHTAQNVHSFDSPNILQILRAMAALGVKNDGQIDGIMSAATRDLPPDLPPRTSEELAYTLWAAAKLGVIPDNTFIVKSLCVVTPSLRSLSDRALCDTLWAVAELGIEDKAFKTSWENAFIQHYNRRLEKLSCQTLANTLWAAAKLGLISRDGYFSVTLAKSMLATDAMCDLEVQDLYNVLWAAAKLDMNDVAWKKFDGGEKIQALFFTKQVWAGQVLSVGLLAKTCLSRRIFPRIINGGGEVPGIALATCDGQCVFYFPSSFGFDDLSRDLPLPSRMLSGQGLILNAHLLSQQTGHGGLIIDLESPQVEQQAQEVDEELTCSRAASDMVLEDEPEEHISDLFDYN